MEKQTNKTFNKRAFVAFVAALAGLGLPVTGLANYFLRMDPLTLQHHAWMSAHNSLGVLFTVFAVWPAILNRRALIKHARGIGPRLPGVRRETVYAVVLVAVTLFIFVGHAVRVQ
ncbi:MAG: DUF4405 domain-containing protein [Deltaproteobacteria bacterium]|nr:DUF4405 domain-containing protein [Deltaproteobacteria bacterium]